MPKIKLQWLTLGLCLLFAVFSLGYYLGTRPQSGVYTIVTERSPDDLSPASAVTDAPGSAAASEAPPAAAPNSLPPPAATEPERDIRININAAPAEELADLPGIGPVLAERIVAYRDTHGPFATPEELINVSGIGTKKLADLLPHITTGG